MTARNVHHQFQVTLEVKGTPDEVWHAIASEEGLRSWMVPTDLEPHEGGRVAFHMGPEATSHGRITGWEPGVRIAYEEDWATLIGQPGADVTPLATEFLIESTSGGTCVVRVVSSAFGTGADWENEFWEEMSSGWGAMLDNLRLYLLHFPGQHAVPLWTKGPFSASPDKAMLAVRDHLDANDVGDEVTVRDLPATVERMIDKHFLLRLAEPMPGLLSFYSFGTEEASEVHLQGYLFGPDAASYVDRELPAWTEWLKQIADDETQA